MFSVIYSSLMTVCLGPPYCVFLMEQTVATQPELFMAMAPVNCNKKVRPTQVCIFILFLKKLGKNGFYRVFFLNMKNKGEFVFLP